MKLFAMVNIDKRENIKGPLMGKVFPYYTVGGVTAFMDGKYVQPKDEVSSTFIKALPGMVGVIQGDETMQLYIIDADGEPCALPVKIEPIVNEFPEA